MAALTGTSLADRVDALLPQTQCRQCKYDGCRPYAEALALGETEINRCPPGGEPTIRALGALLDRPFLPLNTALGQTLPKGLAVIDEQLCIGCTLCIQDCPVDAILGAAKLMHTVISDECTGCGLCLARCPVDCIQMVPVQSGATGWSRESASSEDLRRADQAGRRYHARIERLERLKLQRAARRGRPVAAPASALPFQAMSAEARRQAIAEAVERAKTKKSLQQKTRNKPPSAS